MRKENISHRMTIKCCVLCWRTIVVQSVLFWLIITNVFLIQETHCIKLHDVVIPMHRTHKDRATLKCQFDMERDTLYSVKWYKDDYEFFRYMPTGIPPAQIFPVPGVYVDMSATNLYQVELKQLNTNSSGVYKCEVSGEGPAFSTVSEQGQMTVIHVPDGPPLITGIMPEYNLKDIITANCTSFKSKPAAKIEWYLNGKKLENYQIIDYTPVNETEGLETSILGLRLIAVKTMFKPDTIKLKCTATIGTLLYQKAIETKLKTSYNQQRLARRDEMTDGSTGLASSKSVLCLVVIISVARLNLDDKLR